MVIIRVSGIAKIIKDRSMKAKIADHCDFFDIYWESVDDPSYTLIEISPKEIEYIPPGEFQPQNLKL